MYILYSECLYSAELIIDKKDNHSMRKSFLDGISYKQPDSYQLCVCPRSQHLNHTNNLTITSCVCAQDRNIYAIMLLNKSWTAWWLSCWFILHNLLTICTYLGWRFAVWYAWRTNKILQWKQIKLGCNKSALNILLNIEIKLL